MALAPGRTGGRFIRASLISHFTRSKCSGATPCPVPSSLEWSLHPLAQSLSVPPSPRRPGGGSGWGGPGPGWNVWSWWVGEWG